MYNYRLHQQVNAILAELPIFDRDVTFASRFAANTTAIHSLFMGLYGHRADAGVYYSSLLQTIAKAYVERSAQLRLRDDQKEATGHWFLSNDIVGMSLYADRFSENLPGLRDNLAYFTELGVNFLHLMPVFKSPPGESDGGYAVSDFREVDERFGTIEDLRELRQAMGEENMYLMIDIVLNHTSHRHEWAKRAVAGDSEYQDYYYFFPDRTMPDRFDETMPDIFPASSPGNFTYVAALDKWVMTVFHRYQWDLNYSNPAVFIAMLDNIFFYANLGVDILRIDAPAFIWKEPGTTCQNLPNAHNLLRLIRQCVQVAAPGMALLGEAIVAPAQIMQYFGTGLYTARECDFAYNATQMALQWDALATGNTQVMLTAQHELLQKPYGTSWITYTRCHDDIGLGYDDDMIRMAGFSPYEHRKFLKEYYSGSYPGSPATGALFSVNPKTQDARISGTLASLCGLEQALADGNDLLRENALRRILLMQAMSFFLGGIPMLFSGDELGYTNDYSFENDPGMSYDNRWMHRPAMSWRRNENRNVPGTPEYSLFTATKRLIQIRKKLPVTGDYSNITWISPHSIHVAAFVRDLQDKRLCCVFNFSRETVRMTWYVFKQYGAVPVNLYEHYSEKLFTVGPDNEFLELAPYQFMLLEPA